MPFGIAVTDAEGGLEIFATMALHAARSGRILLVSLHISDAGLATRIQRRTAA